MKDIQKKKRNRWKKRPIFQTHIWLSSTFFLHLCRFLLLMFLDLARLGPRARQPGTHAAPQGKKSGNWSSVPQGKRQSSNEIWTVGRAPSADERLRTIFNFATIVDAIVRILIQHGVQVILHGVQVSYDLSATPPVFVQREYLRVNEFRHEWTLIFTSMARRNHLYCKHRSKSKRFNCWNTKQRRSLFTVPFKIRPGRDCLDSKLAFCILGSTSFRQRYFLRFD